MEFSLLQRLSLRMFIDFFQETIFKKKQHRVVVKNLDCVESHSLDSSLSLATTGLSLG